MSTNNIINNYDDHRMSCKCFKILKYYHYIFFKNLTRIFYTFSNHYNSIGTMCYKNPFCCVLCGNPIRKFSYGYFWIVFMCWFIFTPVIIDHDCKSNQCFFYIVHCVKIINCGSVGSMFQQHKLLKL